MTVRRERVRVVTAVQDADETKRRHRRRKLAARVVQLICDLHRRICSRRSLAR